MQIALHKKKTIVQIQNKNSKRIEQYLTQRLPKIAANQQHTIMINKKQTEH